MCLFFCQNLTSANPDLVSVKADPFTLQVQTMLGNKEFSPRFMMLSLVKFIENVPGLWLTNVEQLLEKHAPILEKEGVLSLACVGSSASGAVSIVGNMPDRTLAITYFNPAMRPDLKAGAINPRDAKVNYQPIHRYLERRVVSMERAPEAAGAVTGFFPATAEKLDMPPVAFRVKVKYGRSWFDSGSLSFPDGLPATLGKSVEYNLENFLGSAFSFQERHCKDKLLAWLGPTGERTFTLEFNGSIPKLAQTQPDKISLHWRLAYIPPQCTGKEKYASNLLGAFRLVLKCEAGHLINPDSSEAVNSERSIRAINDSGDKKDLFYILRRSKENGIVPERILITLQEGALKTDLEESLCASVDNSAIFVVLRQSDGLLEYEHKPAVVRAWSTVKISAPGSPEAIWMDSDGSVVALYHSGSYVVGKAEQVGTRESQIDQKLAHIRGTFYKEFSSAYGFVRLDPPQDPDEFVKAVYPGESPDQYPRLLISQITEIVNVFLRSGANPKRALVLQDPVREIFSRYGVVIPATVSMGEFADLAKRIGEDVVVKKPDEPQALPRDVIDGALLDIGSSAVRGEVIVADPYGIHAKNAAQIVELSRTFEDATIRIVKGDKFADCKSITKLMAIGVAGGQKVEIIADGNDAESALEGMTKLIGGVQIPPTPGKETDAAGAVGKKLIGGRGWPISDQRKFLKSSLEYSQSSSFDGSVIFVILTYVDGSFDNECMPGMQKIWKTFDELQKEMNIPWAPEKIEVTGEGEVFAYYHAGVLDAGKTEPVGSKKSEIGGKTGFVRGTLYGELSSPDGFIRLDPPVDLDEFIKSACPDGKPFQRDRLLASQIVDIVDLLLKIGANPAKELVLSDSVKNIFSQYGVDMPERIGLRRFAELAEEMKEAKSATQSTVRRSPSIDAVHKLTLDISPDAVRREVKVDMQHGIHFRSAAMIVIDAMAFDDAKIIIRSGDRFADCKSIRALTSLGVEKGQVVELITDGKEAKKASDAMARRLGAAGAVQREPGSRKGDTPLLEQTEGMKPLKDITEDDELLEALWLSLREGNEQKAVEIANSLRGKGFTLYGIKIDGWEKEKQKIYKESFTSEYGHMWDTSDEGLSEMLFHKIVKDAKTFVLDRFGHWPEDISWGIKEWVVYELLGNLFRYAECGYLVIKPLRKGSKEGVLIMSVDRGRGIRGTDLVITEENIAARYGYDGHTKYGFPRIRHVMDSVSIEGIPGEGSRIMTYKWLDKSVIDLNATGREDAGKAGAVTLSGRPLLPGQEREFIVKADEIIQSGNARTLFSDRVYNTVSGDEIIIRREEGADPMLEVLRSRRSELPLRFDVVILDEGDDMLDPDIAVYPDAGRRQAYIKAAYLEGLAEMYSGLENETLRNELCNIIFEVIKYSAADILPQETRGPPATAPEAGRRDALHRARVIFRLVYEYKYLPLVFPAERFIQSASRLIENNRTVRTFTEFPFEELLALYPDQEETRYEKEHIARVSRYAMCIARELGLRAELVELIGRIAIMHDFGGMGSLFLHGQNVEEMIRENKSIIEKYGLPYKKSKEESLAALDGFLQERPTLAKYRLRDDDRFYLSMARVIVGAHAEDGKPLTYGQYRRIIIEFSHERFITERINETGIALSPAEEFIIWNHYCYPTDFSDTAEIADTSGMTAEEMKLLLDILIFCDVWENGNNAERLFHRRGIEYQPLKRTFELFDQFYGNQGLDPRPKQAMMQLVARKDPAVVGILEEQRPQHSSDALREEEFDEMRELLASSHEDSAPDTAGAINADPYKILQKKRVSGVAHAAECIDAINALKPGERQRGIKILFDFLKKDPVTYRDPYNFKMKKNYDNLFRGYVERDYRELEAILCKAIALAYFGVKDQRVLSVLKTGVKYLYYGDNYDQMMAKRHRDPVSRIYPGHEEVIFGTASSCALLSLGISNRDLRKHGLYTLYWMFDGHLKENRLPAGEKTKNITAARDYVHKVLYHLWNNMDIDKEFLFLIPRWERAPESIGASVKSGLLEIKEKLESLDPDVDAVVKARIKAKSFIHLGDLSEASTEIIHALKDIVDPFLANFNTNLEDAFRDREIFLVEMPNRIYFSGAREKARVHVEDKNIYIFFYNPDEWSREEAYWFCRWQRVFKPGTTRLFPESSDWLEQMAWYDDTHTAEKHPVADYSEIKERLVPNVIYAIGKISGILIHDGEVAFDSDLDDLYAIYEAVKFDPKESLETFFQDKGVQRSLYGPFVTPTENPIQIRIELKEKPSKDKDPEQKKKDEGPAQDGLDGDVTAGALNLNPEAKMLSFEEELRMIAEPTGRILEDNEMIVTPAIVNLLITVCKRYETNGKALLAIDSGLGNKSVKAFLKNLIKILKHLDQNNPELARFLRERLQVIDDDGENLAERVKSILDTGSVRPDNVMVIAKDGNLGHFKAQLGAGINKITVTSVNDSDFPENAYFPLPELALFTLAKALRVNETYLRFYYNLIPGVDKVDSEEFREFCYDENGRLIALIKISLPNAKRFEPQELQELYARLAEILQAA